MTWLMTLSLSSPLETPVNTSEYCAYRPTHLRAQVAEVQQKFEHAMPLKFQACLGECLEENTHTTTVTLNNHQLQKLSTSHNVYIPRSQYPFLAKGFLRIRLHNQSAFTVRLCNAMQLVLLSNAIEQNHVSTQQLMASSEVY